MNLENIITKQEQPGDMLTLYLISTLITAGIQTNKNIFKKNNKTAKLS